MSGMSDTMTKAVALFPADELQDGEMRQARLPDGHAIAVYRVGEQFYATDDKCTHGEVSLTEEGTLSGCIVECSFHFGSFDVTTGAAMAMPCEVALKTYSVRVEGGIVYVEV
jgi:p-cumate 2,3-dioxygenase ferredoxin subunit